VLQVMEQVPAEQVVLPLGSLGHTVQAAPQAEALSSRAQVLPHAWKPVLQTNPHTLDSHLAWDAPVGTGHTVHVGPQPVTSPLDRHSPLQGWVPSGHSPEQAVPLSMQTPLHKVLVSGHLPPHEVPSQVAVPPCGIGHAVHALPQLLGSLLETHFPPHECSPVRHSGSVGTSTAASTIALVSVLPLLVLPPLPPVPALPAVPPAAPPIEEGQSFGLSTGRSTAPASTVPVAPVVSAGAFAASESLDLRAVKHPESANPANRTIKRALLPLDWMLIKIGS
jgi:hypothetical protein